MEFRFLLQLFQFRSTHIEGAIISSICRRFLYDVWGENDSATPIDKLTRAIW